MSKKLGASSTQNRLTPQTCLWGLGSLVAKSRRLTVSFPILLTIVIDILGTCDPNNAPQESDASAPPEVRYTGADDTPVLIKGTKTVRSTVDPTTGTGSGFDFVVLRAEDDSSIGTLENGDDWNGLVTFSWNPNEKRYESDAFTVTLKHTIEVGPKPLNNQPYQNEVKSKLSVTIPAIQTTRAQNGYCLLIKPELSAQNVLLGSTATNGAQIRPEFTLENVTKSGSMKSIDQYVWKGVSAVRIKVGGTYALYGPHPSQTENTHDNYFERLRNMKPLTLLTSINENFKAIVQDNANWDAANDATELVATARKFNNWNALRLNQPRAYEAASAGFERYPNAGLPRNSYKGAAWYPLTDPMPRPAHCQNLLNFAGDGDIASTGHQVISTILNQAVPTVDHWKASELLLGAGPIKLKMEITNSHTLRRHFYEPGMYPPFIASSDADVVQNWKEDIVGTLTNATYPDAVAAHQTATALVATTTATTATRQTEYNTAFGLYSAQLAADPDHASVQAPNGALYTGWQTALTNLNTAKTAQAEAEEGLIDAKRGMDITNVPEFSKWYTLDQNYDGRLKFAITASHQAANPDTHMSAYTDQHMGMVRVMMEWYKDTTKIDFDYKQNADPPVIEHEVDANTSEHFFFLCDVDSITKVTEANPVRHTDTLRASGSVEQIFGLTQYEDAAAANAATQMHVRRLDVLADTRHTSLQNPGNAGYAAVVENEFAVWHKLGVGSSLEILTANDVAATADAATGLRPILIKVVETGDPGGSGGLLIQDLVFGFDTTRFFFLQFNNVGRKNDKKDPTCLLFTTADCKLVAREHSVPDKNLHLCTAIVRLFKADGSVPTLAQLTAIMADAHEGMGKSISICQLGPKFQELWFGSVPATPVSVFDAIRTESREVGPVFRSQRRISQHLCAPVLNPNARIGCSAPLNYETPHLPPELRDFELIFRNVDWNFLPGVKSLEPIMLYEFNGGTQKVATEDNLLHLPQFKETSTTSISELGEFDFTSYSPYGMPSYFAIFARDIDFSKDYERQPLIKKLSIMCQTTQKRSDTILDASVHQLFHIPQRNTHVRAEYDRAAFNHRQVILLTAEDIGMMGLDEYQIEKRTVFRFEGSVDSHSRVTVLMIYNNRGLYIEGKQLSVVRLQK